MKPYKIDLPDFVLTELYKESLVLLKNDQGKGSINTVKVFEEIDDTVVMAKDQPVSPSLKEEKTVAYLGSNGKYISIIVKDEQAMHLQDDLLDILSAILGACKLNLADVAIINMQHQVVNDAVLRNNVSPKVVMLFGVETTAIDLPFSIPMYKPQAFNNCTYLQSVSLEKMKGASTEAKLEKSKLWVCLKNLFGI